MGVDTPWPGGLNASKTPDVRLSARRVLERMVTECFIKRHDDSRILALVGSLILVRR
jgi:hypothetical protein